MVTVDVDDSSQQADIQPKARFEGWYPVCFHQMNGMNYHNDSAVMTAS